MTAAAIRGRIWITMLEVLAAAMCFMAITQIANTVALRGLALVGLRDDVPVLVSVTGCGKTIATTPVAQARDLQICESEGTKLADIVATAPGGQAVSLLVNGGWLMLGFLSGFSFHRIRGEDGFVKALVFFAGVLLTYGISSLFSTADGV